MAPNDMGETENEPMAFADEAQARHILSLIMCMCDTRIQNLQEGEYGPLIFERQEGGKPTPIINE